MAIRDLFKFSRKTFFNPLGWIDYNFLVQQNRTIATVLRGLFSKATPDRRETFEEAKARLHLSEPALNRMRRNYKICALFFLLLGILVFAHSFYILFAYYSITGWLIGMGVTAMFLSQAFRYDFWALQIEKRHLGITFKQWQKHWLGDKGKSL